MKYHGADPGQALARLALGMWRSWTKACHPSGFFCGIRGNEQANFV
jgi:hypothetical protein